jgi:hypothetical protein
MLGASSEMRVELSRVEQPRIGSRSLRLHGGRRRLVVSLVVALETTSRGRSGVDTSPWRNSLCMSVLVAFEDYAT